MATERRRLPITMVGGRNVGDDNRLLDLEAPPKQSAGLRYLLLDDELTVEIGLKVHEVGSVARAADAVLQQNDRGHHRTRAESDRGHRPEKPHALRPGREHKQIHGRGQYEIPEENERQKNLVGLDGIDEARHPRNRVRHVDRRTHRVFEAAGLVGG